MLFSIHATSHCLRAAGVYIQMMPAHRQEAHLSCSLENLRLHALEASLLDEAISNGLHRPDCKGALRVVQVVVLVHHLPGQH